jgi:cob(I)alamin adenosyltransferase
MLNAWTEETLAREDEGAFSSRGEDATVGATDAERLEEALLEAEEEADRRAEAQWNADAERAAAIRTARAKARMGL